MNTVKVRNIEIGSGVPKICVPIVGVTKDEIIAEAKTFDSIPVDVVEWRVDWFEGVFEFDKVEDVLKDLREALGETPILFTFRTSKEGGEKAIEAEPYKELNIAAAKTGYVDLVDVEAFTGDEIVKEIVAAAHECGVKVVASNHDFDKTPAKSDLIYRLRKMQDMGADILKVAVMPQNKADVLTLLSATEEMYRLYAQRPLLDHVHGVGRRHQPPVRRGVRLRRHLRHGGPRLRPRPDPGGSAGTGAGDPPQSAVRFDRPACLQAGR